MYQPLAPCPGCSRHVRVADGQCPFCGTAFATALAPRPGVAARTRLSRAALFTFAASVGSAGCSSAVTNTDASPADTAAVVDQPAVVDRPVVVTDSGPADTGTVARDSGPADTGGIVAAYGGPPPTDAGPPDDDGGTFAEYGGPPLTDAGPPDDEGNSSADYGSPPERDGGGIFPLYGAPARPDDAGV